METGQSFRTEDGRWDEAAEMAAILTRSLVNAALDTGLSSTETTQLVGAFFANYAQECAQARQLPVGQDGLPV